MIFRRRNAQDSQPHDAGRHEEGYEPGYEATPPYDGTYGFAERSSATGSFAAPPADPPARGPYPPPVDDGGPAEGGYVAYADVAPQLSELARLRAERGALIALCLYARDRVNSPAAAERIDAGLAELGIVPLVPDGEQFDPAKHEAAASVPTDDPALHGTVAETEVPGYADRGAVVRPPVVAVYRQGQV